MTQNQGVTKGVDTAAALRPLAEIRKMADSLFRSLEFAETAGVPVQMVPGYAEWLVKHLRALCAEVETLRSTRAEMQLDLELADSRMSTLRARVAELEADARRLDKLEALVREFKDVGAAIDALPPAKEEGAT